MMWDSTLIQSKITVPELPSDLVERSSLMTKLGIDFSRKLTLVSAPAGCGKTTLVTSWLRLILAYAAEDTPVHVGWYALDESDNDVHRFYRYLVRAIQHANPKLLPDWMDFDYRAQLPTVEEMVNELVDGIWQCVDPILLTLDDYHYLSNKEVHRLVILLLRYLPSNLHLIITSRWDPPIGLAQLRARNQLHEVGARHLAFSLDEAETFLAGALHTPLDRESVVGVWKRLDGWAAGLRLTALSLQGSDDPERLARRFGQQISRYVTEYLVDEVVSQQPPHVSDFLVQISILDRFNAHLCAVVTGGRAAESQAILDYLLHHNLFTVALDEQGEWYRFHHLFREFLCNRLRMQCAKEEVAALHRQAAIWFAANDLTQEAVAHFLAAGDEEGAARTVETLILDLVNSEQFTTLEQWVSLLPRSLVERRPALLLATAWIHNMRSERDAFPAILARVEAILSEERWQKVDTTALWGQVHALRAAICLRSGDSEALISSAELAFNLLPAAFVWVRAFVLNILAHLYTLIGKPEEAHQMLAIERSKVTLTPSIYLLRLSFSDGAVYHLCGTVAERRRAANYHLALASQLNNPLQSAWAEYGLGIQHLECGEIDEAVKRLESVLARRQFAFTITLFLVASDLLPIYASRSQFVEGSSLLNTLAHHLRGTITQSSQSELGALQAYWACLTGDRAAAAQWAESAELVLPPLEVISLYNLTLARVLFMLGGATLERAAKVTSALISYYRKINLIIRLIETLVLHARICWARRMHTPALTAMHEALDLGYPRGYRHTFMDQNGITREILYQLSQDRRYATMAGDLLAEMIVKSNQQPISTTQPSDNSGAKIESLSDREFEILTLMAQRLTNKEIAYRLRISPLTVRNHTARIYAKFHVPTRRQAVLRGRQLGILTADTYP